MSAVLKPNDRMLRDRPLRPLNLDDMEDLAERIIEGARTKARDLLREAHDQAERIGVRAAETGRKEGLDQGHQEGLQRGSEEGLARATEQFNQEQRQLLETLRDVLRRFEDERNRLLNDARDDVVRLAIGIARRVTKRFAATDTRVAVENLREVLDRIGQRHVVQITVNPADAESIRRFASGLATAAERWKHVTITESDDIVPGGCRIRLPEGGIDASIETQLDRIASALLPGDEQA